MCERDVIVIGGGVNALACATLLARAGRRVVLCEASEVLGGTAAVDEFAPGFRCPAVFCSADRLHPALAVELDLASHGLEVARGGDTLLLRPGETPLRLPAEDPGRPFGETDRAALARFEALCGRIQRALGPLLSERLPTVQPRGLGDLLELVTAALRLRRLGRRDMPEAIRMLPMPARDIVQEWFADEALRAAVVQPALACSWLGPFSPGGGLSLLLHRPMNGLLAPPRLPVGGGGVAGALSRAAVVAGVDVRCSAPVAKIRVHDERVAGVVLEDGTEIHAPAVVSGTDPRSTMLGLLERGWLEPDVATAYGNVRARGTVSVVRLALDALPEVDGIDAGGWLRLGPSTAYQEQAFDHAKYGTLPEAPIIDALLPSLHDSSLAPAGKHVLHARVQYTPHLLAGGAWDAAARRCVIDTAVRALDACLPGVAARVLHADALTPADIQARWRLSGGHPNHAEVALDQALYLRPIAGWYDYATPVAGLYLCGPGCHPGGGVTGSPGRNAARRVLEEWPSLTER